ncbi:hypothetical protein K501DRAFT_201762, partial [Backusella circina FSU 941]
SVCKSKLKREKILQENTLAEVCNSIYLSHIQGFCRYSVSKFQDYLKGKLLWYRCTKWPNKFIFLKHTISYWKIARNFFLSSVRKNSNKYARSF